MNIAKKIKHLGKKRKRKSIINIIGINKVKFVVIGVCLGVCLKFAPTVSANIIKKNEVNVDTSIEKYQKNTTEIFANNKENLEFINQIYDQAIENYKQYKIFPSITMAQAILESGWGRSELTKTSNNLFGIKADTKWSGEAMTVSTKENYNDKIVAKFRIYENKGESIKDHAQFLVANKRYEENGVFNSKNYKEQAKALQNAGYSTAKNKLGQEIYAKMLIQLIEEYKLYIFDV